MKKFLLIVLIISFAALLGFSGFKVFQQSKEYSDGEKAYSELAEYVYIPKQTTSQTPNVPQEADISDDPAESIPEDVIAWPVIDFQALSEVNPDIVAWIFCDDTTINYPVVQTNDNSYYLKHLFDGSYNSNGCLFLDCRNNPDFVEKHSIIYGHHMKNGTMFSALDKYKDQAFYESHPTMLLMTPIANYEIILFAGCVADTESNAWKLDFSNDIEFAAWLDSLLEKSVFSCDIRPNSMDRILALSTCSYEFNDARFIVYGILNKK